MNVVFDLGAVLLSWHPARLLQHHLPALATDSQTACALARQVFGHPDWHAFDRGAVTSSEVVSRMAARLGQPAESLDDLLQGIGEALTPMPDSVAVLRELHALRESGHAVNGLYYLSNMPQRYARYLVRQHDFFACFDGGVFSSDVGLIKPEPAIYKLLQQRFALAPARTLFIDDLPANVQAAQSLGWQAVVFESAAQLRVELVERGLLGRE